MFQWLIEVTIEGQRELGSHQIKSVKAWADHGPEHDDKPAAKAWLRRCEVDDSMPQFTAGARLRLAERPLLTRTIVVIEGLDDDESEPAKGPRKKRGQVPDAGVTQEQHAAIRAAAAVEPPPAATRPCECGAHRLRFDQAQIVIGEETHLDGGKSCYRMAPDGVGGRNIRVRATPIPPVTSTAPAAATSGQAEPARPVFVPEPEAAVANDEVGAGEAAALADDAGEEVLDRVPLPPSQDDDGAPAPPSVAASIAAELPPSGPHAELVGKVVEVFDGNAWFWQRYQTENVAGRTFKAVNDAIEQGSTAEQLSGKFTVFMKEGRAPTEAAA